jgi:two-component system NarL family response regulator
VAAAIRVLIVDDHPLIRDGIRGLVGGAGDILIVGEAGDGEEAVALHRQLRPDVTVMDLRLPKLDGVGAIKAIRAEFPSSRIVVLTSFDSEEDMYRAIQAGVRGAVLKAAVGRELLGAIRGVHAGERRIAEEIATRMMERVPLTDLTEREVEVLRHMARGDRNREIAAELGISEATVKSHVVSILGKLGVQDRTAAVTEGIKRGIVRV